MNLLQFGLGWVIVLIIPCVCGWFVELQWLITTNRREWQDIAPRSFLKYALTYWTTIWAFLALFVVFDPITHRFN